MQTPTAEGKARVHWHDGNENALGYGWVLSKAVTQNEGNAYLKFTPRNPTS